MQNLLDEIRNRLSKLRNVETRVQTEEGIAYMEKRTDEGGFVMVGGPDPRLEACRGFVYDFEPDLQMAEVCPGVFLGSQDAANERDLLKSKGITHIINAASGIPNHFPEDFVYKQVEILDTPSEDIKRHFLSCIDFIDQALMAGGAVYVHCNAGVSRSCSICLAYLMKRKQLTLDVALKQVRALRPIVCPNDGFMTQLRQFQVERSWRDGDGTNTERLCVSESLSSFWRNLSAMARAVIYPEP